jgi:hypothetical protein
MGKSHLFELILMCCLEDPVAGDVVSLPADIFPHVTQELAVGDAHVC